MDIAASGPLRLHAAHAAESVDVDVVVSGVKGGFAAPRSRGGVLFKSSHGVVVTGMEEASGLMNLVSLIS